MDQDRIIPADEIIERLSDVSENRLMCMCPTFGEQISRLRLRSITFPIDSTELDSRAREQLAELANALKSGTLQGGAFIIEAHTDNTGSSEYNRRLSLKRALKIKEYLTHRLTAPEGMLTVSGVGESRPWTTNMTSECRRSNRRVEVIRIEPKANGS